MVWRDGGYELHILLLGSLDFAGPLQELGHQVHTCGPGEADLYLADPDANWPELERMLTAKGLQIDAILVTDNIGRRALPTGLWNAEPATAFYGLDSPINRFWQIPYARLFDVALMDQRPQAEELQKLHTNTGWLPVAIDPARYEGSIPKRLEPGVCFVGVVNENLRPKRSAILDKVKQIAPLTIRGGRGEFWFSTQQAAELYRSHQVMLNENLFVGVTTRPLEGMAAGACVLSEAAPGAMDQFFKDGEHLLYFTPGNLKQKLELALGDDRLRRRLAQAGRERVLSAHTLRHRAADIVERLETALALDPSQRPRAGGGEALHLEGQALTMAALRWPGKSPASRLMRGAGRLQAAANDGAKPLPAARAAGLACLLTGNISQAMEFLHRAVSLGGAEDRLVLALGLWGQGRADQAWEAIRPLTGDYPAVLQGPGAAGFHLDAARLLTSLGQGITPGFSRQGLPEITWQAMEHLVRASQLEPTWAQPWDLAGDLAWQAGAPNQANMCFLQAKSLKPSASLNQKIQQTAWEGYL